MIADSVFFNIFDKKNPMIKAPIINEKQYNLIEFGLSISFLTLMIVVVLNHVLMFSPVDTLHSIWTNLVFYLFLPLRLILMVAKWMKFIPDYKTNILGVIWPNYSKENYPHVYFTIQVITLVAAVLLLIYLSI